MGESVTLGNLLYFIKMKNEEFKHGVEEIENKIEGMNKKVQDNSAKMRNWGLAITGVSIGVITVLAKMTASTAEQVENLEKLSIQTGLSTELLTKWGYAAKLNKASLEQLGTGLVYLTKAMRASDLSSQESKDAFNQLGIDIRDKHTKEFRSLADIVDEVRERFSRMKDGAEKTALASKIFGRGIGADLVPFLSLTKEEVNELSQEAVRLGIVLTKDNIDQFAKYKDSLESVEAGLSGVKMTIAADVLPALQEGIKWVKSFLEWFHQLPDPIKKAIPQLALLAAAIGAIVGPILLVVSAWGKLKALILGTDLVFAFQAVAGGAATATEAISMLAASFSPFLIGAAIYLGLSWIINALKELQHYKDLQDADISKINDLATLQEEKKWWEQQLKDRQELLKKYKSGSTGDPEVDKMLRERLQTLGSGKVSTKGIDPHLKQLQDSLKEAEDKIAQINAQTKKVSQKESDLVCPYCGQKFKTQAELSAHIESAHSHSKDTRTPFDKAKDQFESFASTGASAESQLAKWIELTQKLRSSLTGKELDEYTKKTNELKKAVDDAVQKAKDDLKLSQLSDQRDKELAELDQQYAARIKGMKKGEEEYTAVTEKYQIERQKITDKWNAEILAQDYELQASRAKAREDIEAQEIANENANFVRQINTEGLTNDQLEKMRIDHDKNLLDIGKKYAVERTDQEYEFDATLAEQQGNFEQAEIDRENARYQKEISASGLTYAQLETMKMKHEKNLSDIGRKYAGEREAQTLEYRAILAEQQGNFEQAEVDRENARYQREISAADLTKTQIETIEAQHNKNLIDIKKKHDGERKAQQLEFNTASARLLSQYEQAEINQENARFAREISAAGLTQTQLETMEKIHQKNLLDINKKYTDERAQNQLKLRQSEIDGLILELEYQKELVLLQPDQIKAQREALAIEGKIVELKREKIQLMIIELKRQKEIAEAAGDQQKVIQLQEQINQLQNELNEVNKKYDMDIKRNNQELINSWSDLTKQMIKGTKTWNDVWEQTLDNALDKLIDFVWQAILQSGPLKEIFAGLGDFLGMGGGGFVEGGLDNVGNGGGGILRGIIGGIGKIFGFAGGGIVGLPFASRGMITPSNFGTDTVPAMLTPKEMVLPREISEFIIEAVKNQSKGGGGDTYIINAIDTQSFQQALARPENRHIIAGHNAKNQKQKNTIF